MSRWGSLSFVFEAVNIAPVLISRVPVRMVDGAADHLVGGRGRIPSDQSEPVVEGVVAPAAVLVPEVGAQDLGKFAEESHDPLAVIARVALPGLGFVVPGRRGSRGKEGCHELAAEAVHVVEERLLELRGAGDAVALDRVRCCVDNGLDLRGASQDEVRELFFRADDCSTRRPVSATDSSRTRSLSFLPEAMAFLNSVTIPTGIVIEWFLPLSVYWKL